MFLDMNWNLPDGWDQEDISRLVDSLLAEAEHHGAMLGAASYCTPGGDDGD